MSSMDQPGSESRLHRMEKYALDTLGGLRTFILRGNVVDLAIGIVIGAAFTSVVNGLVNDIITPLIPVPGNALAGWIWQVPYAKKGVAVNFGAFFGAIISFLIVAVVLYFFVVKPVAALLARYDKQPEPPAPATRDCPYCLQSIPQAATRCAYCTSVLATANVSATGDTQ